jgi:hypothetical protein
MTPQVYQPHAGHLVADQFEFSRVRHAQAAESITRHPVPNIAAEHHCGTTPGNLNKPSEIKWFGLKID